MAIAVRRQEVEPRPVAGIVKVRRSIAAAVEWLGSDEDKLGQVIFSEKSQRIVAWSVGVYVSGAALFMIGRELIRWEGK